jgi:folate-binding protein YgfZ
MKLYLCNKTILRFYPKGPAFVNAYSTNTVEAPLNAFVDIAGKIVAVVHQHKLSDDEMHVIVETPFVDRLTGHLRTFLSLSETRVEPLEGKKVYWDLDAGRLCVSDTALTTNVSEEEFTRYRLENAVPLQGIDFDEEMVLNIAGDGLISYTKGCYLGQEIVARVHYRGKPPKRLEIKRGSECSAEENDRMTSKVFDPVLGDSIGFVLTDNRLA